MTRRIILLASAFAVVSAPALATTPKTTPQRPLPNLSGTWARAQVTTALVDIPVVGELASRTLAVTLLRVRQRGSEVVLTEQVCRLTTQAPTSLVRTTYPEAFIEAVSGTRRRGRLRWDGDRVRYVEPKQAYWRGMRPDIAIDAPMPIDSADPRVDDLDRDGRPGLTVEVGGIIDGQIFLVQRSWSKLEGVVRSGNRIEGRVQWGSEESILGATRDLLRAKPKKRPDPARTSNFFRMRRVPTSATCTQVIARRRALFGI